MENINTPEKLYNFICNNITYGFISRDKKRYVRKELNDDKLYENNIFNNYYLQTPEELLVSKCGICYDQVELERKWFLIHGYNVYTFYMNYHNHAFLIYEKDNIFSLIECTIKKFNGIFHFNSLNEVLSYVREKQMDGDNSIEINFYKYDEVIFGSNFYPFIEKCKENGIFY